MNKVELMFAAACLAVGMAHGGEGKGSGNIEDVGLDMMLSGA